MEKQCSMSYHILIYGAPLREIMDKIPNLELSEDSIFKRYWLPMYGREDGGETFIGYQYNVIRGLYDKLHKSTTHTLRINNHKVSNEIRNEFKKEYPGVRGRKVALIQNVYTSHYATACVAYGYFIATRSDTDLDNLDTEAMSDKPMIVDGVNLNVIEVAHDMADNLNKNYTRYFYGRIIEKFVALEDGETDPEKLAKQLNKLYKSVKLPSKQVMESQLQTIAENSNLYGNYPILAVLETMCHSCT